MSRVSVLYLTSVFSVCALQVKEREKKEKKKEKKNPGGGGMFVFVWVVACCSPQDE